VTLSEDLPPQLPHLFVGEEVTEQPVSKWAPWDGRGYD
jgi:hypothetical protein